MKWKVQKLVKQVELYASEMEKLSDSQLSEKTQEFKTRLSQTETLDDILPEAYAVVREASKRITGMYQFPVQILSGIYLHKGYVCEQATGEGKTVVAAMPAYLNALEGKGVHIVTVNDYLAKRDADNIGRIYRFLGLSVGCILKEMSDIQRQEEYAKDITYVTNTEVGFDYLRDNMVKNKTKKTQRGFAYCIIDEVDSVLIDEARTPLIISGEDETPNKIYTACDILARKMKKGEASGELTKRSAFLGEDITETGDFIVNEKEKVITLTEAGVKKAEAFFGMENLSNPDYSLIYHNIMLALRAHNLMKKDRDYVIKNGEVLIVDEFTGRTMPGRKFSDGLHQALEAKEWVKINKETTTLAGITYQNFFNKYKKKCGMTGTAYAERNEFKKIYHMNVVKIPTNKPVIRKDAEDIMFITKKEKFHAVVDAVKEAHSRRQPVLIGTAAIKDTEELHEMLICEKIPHFVLNAKYPEKEAEIISHAGKPGSVTIATNMAGRGTDIKLEEESRKAGGLLVIGTQRHESRRIDDQLRGRAGRQGDPGESKFYLSLEDDLMRMFGSQKFISVFKQMGIEENEEIQHRSLSRFIQKAQKKVEYNNFSTRKSVLDFDKVNNMQRELIYDERDQILEQTEMSEMMLGVIKDSIIGLVEEKVKGKYLIEEEYEEIVKAAGSIFSGVHINIGFQKKMTPKELENILFRKVSNTYKKCEKKYPDINSLMSYEKQVMLAAMDQEWMNHLNDLEILRQNIALVGFGQKDPVLVYKERALALFRKMLLQIKYDIVCTIFAQKIQKA